MPSPQFVSSVFTLHPVLSLHAGEPLARFLPDRAEGPAVAEPVPAAGAARQARVRLLPADLLPPVRHQATQARLGRGRQQAEVDHQTSEYLSASFPRGTYDSVLNRA